MSGIGESFELSLELVGQHEERLRDLSRQFKRLDRQQEKMNRTAVRAAKSTETAWKSATAGLKRTTRQSDMAVRSMRGLTSMADRGAQAFKRLALSTARWASIAAGVGAGASALLLRRGLKLNQQMDTYRLSLTTVMKSQARANSLITWIIRFAEKTPFEVQGLVETSTRIEL